MTKEAKLDTLFDRRGKGKCEVLNFLDTLSDDELASVFDALEKIKEFGVNTPRRFLEHLGGGLFAVRARDEKVRLRILAFIFKDYLIATHGFKKKQGAIAESEIKKIKKVKKEWDKNGKLFLQNILGD